MNNKSRVSMEKSIVRKLIKMMRYFGWNLHSVYDSEETIEVSNENEAINAVFAVDEASIFFRRDGRIGGVFIVLGNGTDVITDYSTTSAEFEKLVVKHANWVEYNYK